MLMGKSTRRQRIFRLVVILLFTVCIVGLLILPQVNPDNFVVSGQTGSQAFVAHARIMSTTTVFTLRIWTGPAILGAVAWSSSWGRTPFETMTFERTVDPLRC